MATPALLACRPSLAETPLAHGTSCPAAAAHALLSFERPAAGVPGGGAPRRTLKTAQLATFPTKCCDRVSPNQELFRPWFDHRQDSKGTRWMPWHQESMKGVDDCDKPRLGVEQPLTRGFPNGETQRR